MYDIIVVGGGPAGMTAALYGLRNGKTVLVLEKNGFGGQITNSPKVENYPGFLSASGNEIADKMLDQILNQGADIEFEKVTEVTDKGLTKTVKTEEGGEYEGKTVIIATGVKHRLLGLEGEIELIGEGISFCAVCDGDFYKDKKVIVIGGGNSALQEAILLSEKCSEVTIVQDLPYFTGEKRLQDLLDKKSNVKIYTNKRVLAFSKKDSVLSGIKITDNGTGEKQSIECDGVFIAIGLIPENGSFSDLADLNDYGYFDSDEKCLTKSKGIFVAGDCRSKTVRQLTTAVADGATAALAACDYINLTI